MSKKKIVEEFEELLRIGLGLEDVEVVVACNIFSNSLYTIEKETREKIARIMIKDFRQRLKASRNIVKNESGNEVIAGTRITLKEINSWINETLDS